MPKTELTTSTNASDSNTNVNIRLDGPREPCSFRCNKKLWKAFVQKIKAEKLSTCHLLEPFMLAYLTSNVYVSNTSRPLIENFVIERAVKRVRRYEQVEEIVENLVPKSCFYCKCAPIWKCKTVFKGSPIKFLCQQHASQLKRRGEIVSKEQL